MMYFGEKTIKLILKESEKHNVMIMLQSQQEAKKAAAEFKEAAGDEVRMVADWMTLRTEANKFIYFKSIGVVNRGMDGYTARIIIHVPMLEHISGRLGNVCTMKQFITEQMQQDIRMVKMIDYCGEPVPEECCTVDREGGADDFIGCGNCEPEGDMCSSCVVDRIFKEYAEITNQCK